MSACFAPGGARPSLPGRTGCVRMRESLPGSETESAACLMSHKSRRWVTLGLLLGGPIGGWLLKGDRGLLLGLVVSLLAIIWLFVEERKIL